VIFSFVARSSLSKKSLRPCNCVHLLPMLAIVTPYSPPDAIELPIDQIAAGVVFVSERDGVLVGFAALLPRPDGGVELDALFVDPDVRRRGVGRSLVDHCIQIVRTEGSAALCVIGNPHAYDFYRACGFDVIGTMETRFGSGLLMRKMV
jgi:GNAT superfamily N-acetyltransferase